MRKIPSRWVLWIGCGFLALFFLGASGIAVTGLQDRMADSDLAVVPGNTVNPDGTPPPRLQGRLDAALALYRDGHCRAIHVSGGIGAEGFDEAAVMKAYLVASGVPTEAIFTDNQGVNTFETARFTAALIKAKGFKRAILVSQYFHMAQFRLAMSKHGVPIGGTVHSRQFELRDFYSLGREVFGFIRYAVKPTQAA